MGGTCRNKHSAKNLSTALERPVPVPAKNKKKSVQGEEKGFGEEDNTQHAQARCREVQGDMGQVRAKSCGSWCTLRQPRRKKVMVAKRLNGQRVTRTKKTTKTKKNRSAYPGLTSCWGVCWDHYFSKFTPPFVSCSAIAVGEYQSSTCFTFPYI